MSIIAESSLLTLQEASELLNCHPNTLRQWDKLGILQAIRVGNRGDRRYRKEDILKAMSQTSSMKNIPIKDPPLVQDILERVSTPFVAFDKKWNYVYINQPAQKILNMEGKDMIGKNLFTLYPHVQDRPVIKAMEFAVETRTVTKQTFARNEHWYEAEIFPPPMGVSMLIQDITKQKKEEHNNAFLSHVHTILSSTLDYKETLSNISRIIVPELADWFSVDELDKQHRLKIVELSHRDPEMVKLAYKIRAENIVEPERPIGSQYVIKTGKSEFYPNISEEMLAASIKNEKQRRLLKKMKLSSIMIVPLRVRGKIIGVVTFAYAGSGRHYDECDLRLAEEIGSLAGIAIEHAQLYTNLQKELSERKKLTQSLIESEKRLEAYLSHSLDVIQVADQEGRIIYSSPSAAFVSGYTKEEIEGSNAFDYFHPEDKERVMKIFQDLLKSPGKTITTEYRVKHKSGKWIWLETTGTNLFNNPSVKGIVANFRDITERRAIEDKLREQAGLVNNAHDAILVLDFSHKILLWNPEAERLYGWTKKEALGKVSSYLLQTKFPVPVAEVRKNLLEKKVWEGELIHTTKNGKKIIVESRWALIKGNDNKLRILEILRDVTERKMLEERKDAFISIASHELRTPLTSLKVFTQYLQKYASTEDNVLLQRYLQKIVDQTENLSGLVASLLDISKIQTGHLPFRYETFDFMDCIQERVEVANSVYLHKTKVSGTLPTLYGDKERLCQVFDNLLSNAVKYSPQAKNIDVKLSSDEKNAVICVRDYGIGIDERHQKKIFERFFRAGGEYGSKVLEGKVQNFVFVFPYKNNFLRASYRFFPLSFWYLHKLTV